MTASKPLLALSLFATLAGCRTTAPADTTPRSAFVELDPVALPDSVPIGATRALTLSRPTLTTAQITKLVWAMSRVVAPRSPEQLQSATIEFDYRPEHPSIRVAVSNRPKPRLTEPGPHPGIARDDALERAHACADQLAQANVIEPHSYLRQPILERARLTTRPTPTGATLHVTEHYHFVFGQAPNGILLGNSELKIDVDPHTRQCFRIELAFIDSAPADPVNLIISVDDAKSALANTPPTSGGQKIIDEGRVIYWLDPGISSAVVEPRYLSTYTILSDSGMASRAIPFIVTLSQDPPIITEH